MSSFKLEKLNMRFKHSYTVTVNHGCKIPLGIESFLPFPSVGGCWRLYATAFLVSWFVVFS